MRANDALNYTEFLSISLVVAATLEALRVFAEQNRWGIVFTVVNGIDGVLTIWCPLKFLHYLAGVKGEKYIENTINVHRFSFIAKKSLHALKVRRHRPSIISVT